MARREGNRLPPGSGPRLPFRSWWGGGRGGADNERAAESRWKESAEKDFTFGDLKGDSTFKFFEIWRQISN